MLDPGSHRLRVDVYTTSGVAATSETTVTTTRPSVPAELEGKGFKIQTPAQRCPTCDMPDGVWRIEFGADGVIRFDDPLGGKGTEAFVATSDGVLTLYGPTSWIVPKEAQGGFCEADGIATMTWQISGAESHPVRKRHRRPVSRQGLGVHGNLSTESIAAHARAHRRADPSSPSPPWPRWRPPPNTSAWVAR